MRLSDDLVELEIEKLDSIIKACDTDDEKELWENLKTACVNGRRTGLGTHGLADALACLSLAYDSEEGISAVVRCRGVCEVLTCKGLEYAPKMCRSNTLIQSI